MRLREQPKSQVLLGLQRLLLILVLIARGSVATALSCLGDCNGDGVVTLDEIEWVTTCRIDCGFRLAACPAWDPDGDGEIFPNEVTLGYQNFTSGCPHAPMDCDEDGTIASGELANVIAIAFESSELSTCIGSDSNNDSIVTIEDIVSGF